MTRFSASTICTAAMQHQSPTDCKFISFFSEQKFEYADADRKKPAVPTSKDEPPLLGLKTTKNFITKNAVETIMSVPGKPEKKYADTRIGDTHNLIPSGLEPKFVHKKVC